MVVLLKIKGMLDLLKHCEGVYFVVVLLKSIVVVGCYSMCDIFFDISNKCDNV